MSDCDIIIVPRGTLKDFEKGGGQMKKKDGEKNICENRKARHEYHILDVYEAGLELRGTEVKSLRTAKASLQEAYVRIESGQALIFNFHISPYDMGNRFNHDPKRVRRLLLHKSEIRSLYAKVREKGLTIVPLRIYFTEGLAKMEIALAQGKKLYDKRDDIAAKDAKRETDRALRERNKAIV